MGLWLYIGGLYLLTGTILAFIITPFSWPFRRNALLVTFLWPWPIAAELVRMLTGRYPPWTPFP